MNSKLKNSVLTPKVSSPTPSSAIAKPTKILKSEIKAVTNRKQKSIEHLYELEQITSLKLWEDPELKDYNFLALIKSKEYINNWSSVEKRNYTLSRHLSYCLISNKYTLTLSDKKQQNKKIINSLIPTSYYSHLYHHKKMVKFIKTLNQIFFCQKKENKVLYATTFTFPNFSFLENLNDYFENIKKVREYFFKNLPNWFKDLNFEIIKKHEVTLNISDKSFNFHFHIHIFLHHEMKKLFENYYKIELSKFWKICYEKYFKKVENFQDIYIQEIDLNNPNQTSLELAKYASKASFILTLDEFINDLSFQLKRQKKKLLDLQRWKIRPNYKKIENIKYKINYYQNTLKLIRKNPEHFYKLIETINTELLFTLKKKQPITFTKTLQPKARTQLFKKWEKEWNQFRLEKSNKEGSDNFGIFQLKNCEIGILTKPIKTNLLDYKKSEFEIKENQEFITEQLFQLKKLTPEMEDYQLTNFGPDWLKAFEAIAKIKILEFDKNFKKNQKLEVSIFEYKGFEYRTKLEVIRFNSPFKSSITKFIKTLNSIWIDIRSADINAYNPDEEFSFYPFQELFSITVEKVLNDIFFQNQITKNLILEILDNKIDFN